MVPIRSVAPIRFHTLMQVYSCGYNAYGQLGLNDKFDRNEFDKFF